MAIGLILLGSVPSGPVLSQSVREWQVQAVAAVADRDFVGTGPGAGIGSGRFRARLSLSGGTYDGLFGGRGETLALFHLDPLKPRGWAVYGGGGAAAMFSDDRIDEYVVVIIGVEQAPGRSSGWFAELGLGGGMRLSVGYRWRRESRNR